MNHWIPTQRRSGRPVDDHALILQVERANEALDDRVAALEDSEEPDRYDEELNDHRIRLKEISSDLVEMGELIMAITERVAGLERNQNTLLEALKRALLH